MEFHVQYPQLSSCHTRTQTVSQIDMENQQHYEGCSAGCSLQSSQSLEDPVCMDPTCRAPSRVDSCPDMDTRPPLTPELNIMDLDGDVPGEGFHMQELLSELATLEEPLELRPSLDCLNETSNNPLEEQQEGQAECEPCPLHIAMGKGLTQKLRRVSESEILLSNSRGLFLTDAGSEELLHLFQHEEGVLADVGSAVPLARLEELPKNKSSVSCSLQEAGAGSFEEVKQKSSSYTSNLCREDSFSSLEEVPDVESLDTPSATSSIAKVPGPCDPEDLQDGVIFGAQYLGSTQLPGEKHPVASTRMRQAQEAVERIKAPDGESQPMTEVDIMVSTRRVKVLSADTQESLMDYHLHTISYTADIGRTVVLMARRKIPHTQDHSPTQRKPNKILCHVFQSDDAQLIAQAIGQAFGLAYQKFLRSEKAGPLTSGTGQREEQLYNADLPHFSKSDNCREVYIQKQRGEMLGIAVVESGWGSLLPTVVIANLMHGGPAERSGDQSIGDHVTSVNGTSLVGLPFSTCQSLIQDVKGQSEVILSIVRCPPVITAIIQRPSVSHQLGFCIEDGVICSLVRGGIAERGGIRVGHRIIEINGQSVVATAHEKIIQTLMDATGEVHIKTMPASTYRLLTGQEIPVYL
ncbi:amyloid-beta A4 precursor protein-binding family A member 3 isoform X1 [Xenopus laevis]|uniref:Amyloid-beta A4 precursor protein-binding family A member 3 n=2 Tax=Xenopus laevis TaxID=8355 RepID=A0A1L8HMX8_XENLA|nr:amyloid-beta A4 precursor protein-binding family A member 3 isoform X1 [Xenopus laevis]XP_018099008.1 amyloid-beta A4 precursor protein-binding family A member 3 isoform X1 [Xenopus laevis]XP_018099009.1 amyloid-beta A4 precursor protein-binding family A member 3 isoform X1 [Xenopus laevis]OCT97425.1 hypothetical protein XELAEV_18009646mg [Xenopus laevis]